MQSLMGSSDFDPEAAGEADGDEYSRERSESSSVGSRYAAAAPLPHRCRTVVSSFVQVGARLICIAAVDAPAYAAPAELEPRHTDDYRRNRYKPMIIAEPLQT
jgi:hypothetical protein